MKQNITNINALIAPRIVKFIILFAACAAGLVFPSALSAATYTVTNTNSSGAGSLRQAALDASATTADDTITFNISGCPNGVCTIVVANDLPVVTVGRTTIVNSTGTSNLVINGQLRATSESDLTIDGMTITGVSSDAAVYNTGRLTVKNSEISNSRNGITSLSANLTVQNTVIKNNSDFGIYGRGGIVQITNAVISNNNYGFQYGNGSLTITNSTITNNSTVGIYNENSLGPNAPVTVTVTGSTISNNSGKGIYTFPSSLNISNSIITGNTGVGIHNISHPNYAFTLTNSTVSNNLDGGIRAESGLFVSIRGSTITNNRTTGGGGGLLVVGNGTMTMPVEITNTTISNNTAISTNSDGGGILSISCSLSLTNSTVSNNTAAHYGGGIINQPSILIAVNSTIARNTAQIGGGIFNFNNSASKTYLRNSIIAENTATVAHPDIFHGSTDTFTSNGNNLIGNTNTNFAVSWQTSDILNQLPQLTPLRNNGGTTQTHGLLPGSPALNAGNNCVLTYLGCSTLDPNAGLITDQRGRPRNGTVDIGAFERQAIEIFKTPFDFDGDEKSDISIFRPALGEWWYSKSSNGGNAAVQFGSSSDKIVPADYTGDGKTDFAFWRPSNGQWFILRSEDFSFFAFPFGISTDVPVPADYDGDGKADAAVFRPSNLTWYISKSTGGTQITTFGTAGDKPVVADYDGDGKADIAIFRPNGTNGAEWWISRSSNGSVFALQFGNANDKPVQGDYTGDGKADIAVFRPSNGNWFILRSENLSFYSFPFGTGTDIVAPGDYDGDGKFDAAVFRPSNLNWYVQRSTAGTLIQTFGIAGDLPVPNAFVP